MSATKKDLKGLTEQDLEQTHKKTLEKDLGDEGNDALEQKKQELAKPDKEESQSQKETSKQEEKVEQDEDATSEQENELAKYDNVLKNTYGLSEDEITDGVRKIAKSWSELQSKTTTTQQEKKQLEQQLQQFNSLLQKDEELFKHAQAVKNGKSYENPIKQESTQKEQPHQTTGQLDLESVDEKTLVNEGYLDSQKLEGLDDLARERAVAKAEIKYDKDQARKQFRDELQQEQQNLQKQQEQQQIQQYNSEVMQQGLEDFVVETGFNIAELDDETFEEIKQSAWNDRAYSDPRKVKEDAFQVNAKRVLARKGLLSDTQETTTQQDKKQSMLEDTGVSVSKGQKTKSNKNKTVDEQLKEAGKKDFFTQSVSPRTQYLNKTK